MAGTGIIDHDIKMAACRYQRISKALALGIDVAKIEADGVQPRNLRYSSTITRSAPDLVSATGQKLCGSKTDPGAGTSEKDLVHRKQKPFLFDCWVMVKRNKLFLMANSPLPASLFISIVSQS